VILINNLYFMQVLIADSVLPPFILYNVQVISSEWRGWVGNSLNACMKYIMIGIFVIYHVKLLYEMQVVSI